MLRCTLIINKNKILKIKIQKEKEKERSYQENNQKLAFHNILDHE